MQKLQKLEEFVLGYQKVVVGFSGGVDSTLIAYVANKVLKNNALIVLATTETITEDDIELSRTIAKLYNFNFIEIKYNELDIEHYATNPTNRCYYCKKELYKRLQHVAQENNFNFVLDGANTDDLNDYRPGRTATQEFNVRSPLIEAGFNKEDVRKAALFYNLPNANKPAAPCLSSRIPYGTPIDLNSLTKIAKAEKYIRSKGFINVRVRHYNNTAKIEVDYADIEKLKTIKADISSYLNNIGYEQILIDDKGFKSGNLNKSITEK